MDEREASTHSLGSPGELQPAWRDVFVSYHSSDVEHALWIRGQLEQQGWKAFVAHEDLNLQVGSEEWSKAIDDALDRSRALILIVTPRALTSQWVQYEWRSVHNDILANRKGMLIPVCFEGPACPDLPRALRRYQCVDLRDPERRQVAVEDVFELLRGYLGRAEPVVEAPQAPPPATGPFLGWRWREVTIAAAAILLLVFGGYWIYSQFGKREVKPGPTDQLVTDLDQQVSDLTTGGNEGGSEVGDSAPAIDPPAGAASLGVLIVPVATRGRPAPFLVRDLRRELEGPWPTGSLADYFKEVSRGHLALDIEITDWVYPAKAAQLKSDEFSEWAQLFRSVLGMVDPQVAMDRLDHNDDGALDLVIFVLDRTWPGYDRSELAGPWPISWSFATSDLPAYFSTDRKNQEPVAVDDFAVLPGIDPDRSMIDIGPFTHKVGIALGLLSQSGIDSQKDKEPLEGLWSPMSLGSWGADGKSAHRPTHFSGAEKLLLGWVQAEDITGSLIYLKPVQTAGVVARIETGEGGYLVLENRRRMGFDEKIPGEGLLIWQVSGSKIRLIEADGRQDLAENNGEAGDLFPQPGKNAVRIGNIRLRKIREDSNGDISITCDRLSGGT